MVAFGLLALQSRGFRPFERAITGLFAVILIGFLITLARVDLAPGDAAAGLVPRFQGTDSLLLAAGILGATVMPHVIYLHSARTQNRITADTAPDRRFLFRHQQLDVFLAMGLAGIINLSMLLISAALFFGTDIPDTDTLHGVHAGARALDASSTRQCRAGKLGRSSPTDPTARLTWCSRRAAGPSRSPRPTGSA